jgi:predicted tellurium resistance membrane protein TerC
MEWLTQPETLIAFFTLLVLEIVLGIDNIIFISILSAKLPVEQRKKARQLGLAAALITRILLLLSLGWVMSLTKPIMIGGNEIVIGPFEATGKNLILFFGGLFLIWKSVKEIHHKLEGHGEAKSNAAAATFSSVIIQIMILDIVFSLDSVITAVGMVKHIEIMIAAVVVAVGVMLAFANPIADFVEKHPSVKILALAFLIMIGVNLIAESMHVKIPKGYTYFSMAFATCVELLNIRVSRKHTPVKLNQDPIIAESQGSDG